MNFKVGFLEVVLVLFGFVFIILLLGYGAFSKSVEEAKKTLPPNPLPTQIINLTGGPSNCIEIIKPQLGSDVHFPLTVEGTVTGCGWNEKSGQVGTMTVLDANGQAISAGYSMDVLSKKGNTYTFSNTLYLSKAPTTNKGSILLRTLDNGNAYSFPITF